MEKQPINKDVNEEDLLLINKQLVSFENRFISEVRQILENENGKNVLYKSSHFLVSVVNRAIALNRGFITLTKVKNYTSAIPLMRMQIDNCLRLFAMSLVTDRGKFYTDVLSGIHIRNILDAEGKLMTDAYLLKKIKSLYPELAFIYKATSGFIHFSNEHLFINNRVENLDDDSYSLVYSVGENDKLSIIEEVDYSYNMLVISKRLFGLVVGYKKHMIEVLERNHVDLND